MIKSFEVAVEHSTLRKLLERSMCHELLEPTHEPAYGWFEMVCPKISADDLIESLGLTLLLENEQPCDIDRSLEVAFERSM